MESSADEDSSETDVEESARLKEAVLGDFSLQIASELKNATPPKSNGKKLSKPSLRFQNQCDANCDELELQTTPEFRKFMSKHLSDFIESNIVNESVEVGPSSPKKFYGIKLFKGSAAYVDIDDDHKPHRQRLHTHIQRRKTQNCSSSSDSEDELKRLAEAAVSYEFISKNASPLQIHRKNIISDAPKCTSPPAEREYSVKSTNEKILKEGIALTETKTKAKKNRRRREGSLSKYEVYGHFKWENTANKHDLHNGSTYDRHSSQHEKNKFLCGDKVTTKIRKKKKKKKEKKG